MTAPTQEIDPFAGSDKAPAISFKDRPVGTTYEGVITEPARLVQARDYDTGDPAFWPAKPGQEPNPKMAAVLNIEVDGEARSVWAVKPSAMFAALADAQKKAGKPFEVGGRIAIRYTGDKPNDNPKKNPQKLYAVRYEPPAPKDVFADSSSSGDQPPW